MPKKKASRKGAKAAKRRQADEPIFQNRIVGHDTIKAKRLKAHPSNWRVHPDKQRKSLRAVIEDIGFTSPVVVRKQGRDYELLDGHLRADLEPDAELPIVIVDLDDQEALKMLASHDPLAYLAETDPKALQSVLDAIEAETAELEKLLADAKVHQPSAGGTNDAEPQLDRADELRKKWKVKKGQLWEIKGPSGNTHRLLCGDCTDKKQVKRLMGKKRAGLMNTDPPYGIDYDNKSLHPNAGPIDGKVAGDDLADQRLQKFLEEVFCCATSEALRSNSAWYLWHAHLTQGFFAAAAAAANVVLHRQIIWVKPVLVFGRGQYHWKHEPCFMGWVNGHQPPDYAERNQTTVWEIDSVPNADRKEWNHSTPKPLGLFETPIRKHLKAGELCYEPFAGTGPQFVAAENLHRVCYGLELEPKYSAVILQRMADIGCTCKPVK